MARLTESERLQRLSVLVNAILASESDYEEVTDSAASHAPLARSSDGPARSCAGSRPDHVTFWNMFSILSRLGYPTGDDA